MGVVGGSGQDQWSVVCRLSSVADIVGGREGNGTAGSPFPDCGLPLEPLAGGADVADGGEWEVAAADEQLVGGGAVEQCAAAAGGGGGVGVVRDVPVRVRQVDRRVVHRVGD